MKTSILSILFLLIMEASAVSQPLPYLDEPVFKAGEVLSYKLKYGFISAAEGTLKVEHTDVRFRHRPTFHLSAVGKTSSAFSVFYTVFNQYHSYIDKKNFLPYFYTENIREGSYRREDKVLFNQQDYSIVAQKGTF